MRFPKIRAKFVRNLRVVRSRAFCAFLAFFCAFFVRFLKKRAKFGKTREFSELEISDFSRGISPRLTIIPMEPAEVRAIGAEPSHLLRIK